MNVKEYYEGLLKDAGVDETQRSTFLSVLGNENLAKKLNDELVAPKLRQDEFSRKMDELAKSKAAEEQKAREYYERNLKEYENYQKAAREYQQKATELGIDPEKPIVQGAGVELAAFEKKFEEKLQANATQTLAILEWIGQKPVEHFAKYGKPMDVPAVKKLAIEKGISLDQAYAEYRAPLEEEASKRQFEEAVARAKEEGARDALSKHHIPVDSKPKGFSPMFTPRDTSKLDPKAPPFQRDQVLRQGFLEEFSKANATSGS